MNRWRTHVRNASTILLWLAWWAAVGAGVEWLWPRSGVAHPGYGALFGLFMGMWMLLAELAVSKGWIRGTFSDRREVRQKREQLARDREQILQEARAKLN